MKCVEHISDNNKRLDMSKMNLSNNDILFLLKELRKYPLIEYINLSHNKFSIQGLEFLVSKLIHYQNLKEVDFSDNRLLSNNDYSSFSFNYLEDLTTLRLTNAQFNEKTIAHLCTLKQSHIQELYLDNNNIGDQGVLLLTSILKNNTHISVLSLTNNNISDVGIQGLCGFLRTTHTVKSVDIRFNPYTSELTKNQLQSLPSSISVSYDSLNLTHSSFDYLHCKTVKDICIILQLLAILLNEDFAPHIPSQLLFNPSFPNHQQIIMKLLNQPSLLAFRIECVMEALDDECTPEECAYAIHLLMDNFSLIMRYLYSSTTSVLHVSSVKDISPISSAVSSPSLVPSPCDPFQQDVEFDVVINSEIPSTVGMVRRSGIVKVRLLQLCELLLDVEPSLFSPFIISHEFNTLLIDLYTLYPWNSLIHHCVTSMLVKELVVEYPALTFDCIVNNNLVDFVVKEIQQPKKVGYLGFMRCLCNAIEERRQNMGLPFLNFSHEKAFTTEEWKEFYNSIKQ